MASKNGFTDFMVGASHGGAQAAQARILTGMSAQRVDESIAAMGFLKEQVDAWKARFERERANRRGWQEKGMAAREVVQTLAKTDREGAEKLIAKSIEEHQPVLDASLARVDKKLFEGS